MRMFVVVAFAMALLAAAAQAQTAPFGIGPTVSTLGVGLEGSFRAGPYLGFRLDASALSFDYNRTISGIPYKFSTDLRSGGPVLDFYPFGGGFRLSGGARINGNKADVTSTPASSIRVGSNTYTPAQIGTLSGNVDYNRVAPYVGLGYGGRVTSWLELGVDAGVLYQGKPRVSLGASGAFANNPALQADLDQARASIKSKIDWTAWYPVLMLSALFRF
jgi:hypothetical protein